MTEPSTITMPTLEQRAAAITQLCPPGWIVKPYGSTLAIVNPGAPDAPPAVIHSDDAAIVATIWTWHTRAMETNQAQALDARREAVRCGEEVVALRIKLAEVIAEFSAGMFTPADFTKRAVDVDEALREIRERRRLDREERDARFVASEASRETEIVRLRDQLAEAHDYARREMVWVPASAAGMSTSEQVADAIRQETGAEVEPRPHSRPNVLDEVRGLGEQTKRFDRAYLGETAKRYEPVLEADGSIDAEFTDQHDVDVFALKYGPRALGATSEAVRAAGWTGITWMSGKGRAKSLTLPGLRLISVTGAGDKAHLRVAPEVLTAAKAKRVFNKAWKLGRLLTFHLPGGVLKRATVSAIATSDSLAHGAVAGDIFVDLPKPEAPKPPRQGISWRRPGHDVDSFAEVPIRPTYDEGGNQVIEVRAELPEDLQHELKQTSRDRPTITATTVNGAKITGPVTAWRVARSPECVVWHLTVPLRSPPPRT